MHVAQTASITRTQAGKSRNCGWISAERSRAAPFQTRDEKCGETLIIQHFGPAGPDRKRQFIFVFSVALLKIQRVLRGEIASHMTAGATFRRGEGNVSFHRKNQRYHRQPGVKAQNRLLSFSTALPLPAASLLQVLELMFARTARKRAQRRTSDLPASAQTLHSSAAAAAAVLVRASARVTKVWAATFVTDVLCSSSGGSPA